PVASLQTAKSILEIFAPLASSEVRHRQESAQLRKSEQRYRAFIAQSADAMWCVEFEQPISTELPAEEQIELVHRYGYFAECNDAAVRHVGMGHAGELVGRRIADLFRITSPVIRQIVVDLRRSQYRFTTKEVCRVSPDGRDLFVVLSLLAVVEDGFMQRLWGVSHDITQFKQVQRALDASEQRIVDLLQALQVLVLVSDASGSVLSCNDHFSSLTG